MIWTPKLWVSPKMNPKVKPKTIKRYVKLWRWWTLKRKSRQKRWTEKVDRKFRMTPNRPRMILKAKEMTLKKQRMTPKMTQKNKGWNSMFLNQTSEMIVWYSINDSFGKEKQDGIPYPWKSYFSLLLKSKKSMFWHLSETPTKRKTDIKKLITSANERNKAHIKGV